MIDSAPFTRALGSIALQLQAAASQPLIDAYHLALKDETDPREWNAFAAVAVKRFGWKPYVMPAVPEILDALAQFRGQPSRAEQMLVIDAEASSAYARVLETGEYSAEAGRVWTFRAVREACGAAAADAFLAAGGHAAFATTWDESKRRERFIAAYVVVARQDPSARLPLPARDDEPKLLPVARIDVDQQTAERALEQVRQVAGQEPAVQGTPPTPRTTVVTLTPEREAELRRQMEAIGVSRPAPEKAEASS